jgi:hypothetical protein
MMGLLYLRKMPKLYDTGKLLRATHPIDRYGGGKWPR